MLIYIKMIPEILVATDISYLLTLVTRTPFLYSLGSLNWTVLFLGVVGGVDDGVMRHGVVGHVEGDLDILVVDILLRGDV